MDTTIYLEMDADFSHDPNDLPRLYAATHEEGFDIAVGSRYVSGVNVGKLAHRTCPDELFCQ